MAAIAPFSWTRLYIFAPYTPPDRITAILGFPSPGASGAINRSDFISLLVFVRDGRVVESIEQPRSQGDFATVHDTAGYARDSAQFVVRRAGRMVGGAPHWTLEWTYANRGLTLR